MEAYKKTNALHWAKLFVNMNILASSYPKIAILGNMYKIMKTFLSSVSFFL